MALRKSHIAILSLRGISLLFLLISFVILINNGNYYKKAGLKNYFVGLGTYSYMFGATIIGIGYTVLQIIVFVIFQIIMKSDKYIVFEFYGDKAISYLLLSAAAAGIGASRELKPRLTDKDKNVDLYNNFNNYLSKGSAAASLLLPAFVCTAILSILSSYALSKKI
ncbi:CASP-like protein 4D1 [Quercus suber]|uniref:CASP-like protein 4D1 n=1 Tax=Quercus suber TaxID=58331 RepID=UPI000D2E308C|nr:casp-like protein 4d1 [Quercus suber]